MTLRLDRTPQARLDLIEQYQWYAGEGGDRLAERFLDEAERSFAALLETPLMGVRFGTGEADLVGIRKWRVGSPFRVMLIFYRVTDESVTLVRVVNAKRDLRGLLAEGE